jgi:two-component system, OmpR family, phosphate regulon response regulator PhoB
MAYVLIIEPNTVLAKTYTKALRHAGHEVQHATGAQAAIIAADERLPDVVLLELQLPMHNGIEFLQEFRSYADWQSIPVVINTVIPPSRLAPAEPALRQELGVRSIVYKPQTSLEDIVRLVRECL